MSKMITTTLEKICLPEKGSIISGPFGSNISSKYFVADGVPVIRGNNLSLRYDKFYDNGFVFVTKEKADELRCYAYRDDLIFTAAGTIGQVGIIPQDSKYKEYVISNKQIRARLDQTKVNLLYAYYWFSSPWIQRFLIKNNKGSTVPLLTLNEVKDLPITYPESLEEQKSIVKCIEVISKKIESNNRINDNLEATAQAIYSDTVSQIPLEKTDSIYTVLSVINGSPFASEYFNSDKRGFPLVRIRDLSMCNPDIYTDEVINKMEFVNAGDILIGMDGEFIPHIWYGLKGVLNQRVCKVVPNSEFVHPLFLYLTLKPILAEVQRTQGGTTVIHIGKKDFDRMTCVSLSTEEHHSFSKKVSPIFSIMLENYKEILSLRQAESIIMSLLSR